MSSTVNTGKAVAAFKNPKNGEIIYVVFDEGHCKKDPSSSRYWTCRTIGTYEQVMKCIFDWAGICEGGSIQSRNGPIKPENYLKSWRLAFANPFEMADMEFTLKLGGTSMYDTIPDDKVDVALRCLESAGHRDMCDALKAGPVKINLHRDVDIVMALYGPGADLPLWKLVDDLRGVGSTNETLAPKIAKRAVSEPRAIAYAIDNNNVVVSFNSGPLKHLGWRYSTVSHFISTYAYPAEMACSFSAYKMIGKFRDICDQAPGLPDSTIITVTPTKADHCYYVENAQKLAVRLGLYATKDEVPESFETTFGVVRELKEDYLLSTLEDSQVEWTIAPEVDTAAGNASIIPADLAVQQSLF